MAQTLQERRDQFHALRLGEYFDPFYPAEALENLRQHRSSALAYFDCFWLFAVATLAVTLVVFAMKRSVAEKGARIGGE